MSGISAFGTLLQLGRGDGPPETYDTIGGISNITGPGFSTDTIDVTAHDSPGAFEESIVTIIRQGELTVDLNYDPADPQHSADPAALNLGVPQLLFQREKRNWRMIFPSSPPVPWDFEAYVTGFEPSAPYDDKLSASVTLKLTGQPTLA